MSLLWFAFTLKVTLAIYIGSKPAPEGALPGEVLDLEAAVLAKYSNGVTGGSILSARTAHAQPVAGIAGKLSLTRAKASSELTCQAPIEVFDFEKVLLDRNSMSKAESSFLRLQPKGSSTHVAQKDEAAEIAEIGADVLGSSKAGIRLQSAHLSDMIEVQPRVKLQSKRELGASAAPPEVPLEVANLEAAVLAKYAANDETVQPQDEAQQAGAQPEVPLEVAKLEAAVLAKYASDDVTSKPQAEAPQAGGQPQLPLEVATLEAAVLAKYATNDVTSKPQPEAPRVGAQLEVPVQIANLEAAVLAKYATQDAAKEPQAEKVQVQVPSLEVAQLEAAVLAKHATTDAADMAADMARYVTDGQTSKSPAESSHAQASTADVAKLEAAVLEKYAASDRTLLQEGVTMKSYLQQSAANDELSQEVPVQRSITRLVFYFLALSGLVGCAYQKYEVIMETMKGNSEPPQRQSKWEGSYDYSV